MDKGTKLLGLLAAGATLAFLYRTKDQESTESSPFEGLNIDLNPNLLIDSAASIMKINPVAKEVGKAILNEIAQKVMAPKEKD